MPKKSAKLNGKNGAPPKAAYFLSLTVENVRCFGPAQTLDLSDSNGRPARWTIILGDNGTGKTTLLQALVTMLPRMIKQEENELYFIPELPPSINRFWGWQRSQPIDPFNHFSPVNLLSEFACKATTEFWTGSGLGRTENGILAQYTYTMADRLSQVGLIQQDSLGGLVCFSYGASRRMGDTALSEYKDEPHTSLFSDAAALLNAEEWLLQTDYSARIPSTIQVQSTRKRDVVKKILINILPGVEDIRIAQLNESRPTPHIELKTYYGWVTLKNLSLGYKALIAWMVDFASKMFEAYPDSENPLAEPAVVLVDEIDLHLHPSWQRKLIGYLTNLFPNTQFIATTHSPLVVQAAADANLVVLRREGDHVVIDNDVEAVQGWRADQILTSELFDLPSARPPQYDAWAAERRRLLSKSRLTKADRARLLELDELARLPFGETPEDLEAMSILRRAAQELKQKGRVSST